MANIENLLYFFVGLLVSVITFLFYFLGVYSKLKEIRESKQPVLVKSPVSKSYFMGEIPEVNIATLETVPIYVFNKSKTTCVVNKIWIELHYSPHRIIDYIQRWRRWNPLDVELQTQQLPFEIEAEKTKQIDILLNPLISVVEKRCKESDCYWNQIRVSCEPYGIVRSDSFLYFNWQAYRGRVLWDISFKTAAVLLKKCIEDKLSEEATAGKIMVHFMKLGRHPIETVFLADQVFNEEHEKGNVPDSYLEYISDFKDKLAHEITRNTFQHVKQ